MVQFGCCRAFGKAPTLPNGAETVKNTTLKSIIFTTLLVVIASGSAFGDAFIYSGGVFSAFDYPGASATFAEGINNGGQIVGEFTDASGNHGFLYSAGAFNTLNYPGASTTFRFLSASTTTAKS